MEQYEIIQLHQSGLSNRKIAVQLQLSRTTVNRHIQLYKQRLIALRENPNDIELQVQLTSAPTYDVSKRKTKVYTKEIDDRVDELLAFEAEKLKLLGSHKQRLSGVQLHEILIEEGFSIGRSTLNEYLRLKRKSHQEVYVKQVYPFGHRVEFDFGEVKLMINGERRKCTLAVFTAPASGFRWAKLYLNAKQQVFIDAHIEFFKVVGGVYTEVVYDNMKNVVTKFIGRSEKELNPELIKMATFYGFRINVTNCFSGNEKGSVERSVDVIRNRAYSIKYSFETRTVANNHLMTTLEKLNKKAKLLEEQKHLQPMIAEYQYYELYKQKSNKYGFLCFDTNFYSVPEHLCGRSVIIHKCLDKLQIYANNQHVATHMLLSGTKQYSIQMKHYLQTLLKKPGALRHSHALSALPELRHIFETRYIDQPKVFIQTLITHQDKDYRWLIEHLQITPLRFKQVKEARSVDETRNQIARLSALYKIGEEA